MNKKLTKSKAKKIPPKTKWGVRVYYDAETENFLRETASRLGFSNVQEYLKYKARRERMAHELLAEF